MPLHTYMDDVLCVYLLISVTFFINKTRAGKVRTVCVISKWMKDECIHKLVSNIFSETLRD